MTEDQCYHERNHLQNRIDDLEDKIVKLEATALGYINDVQRTTIEWARAYWEITKNLNMGELSDYDDELASNVQERRQFAENILFGEYREQAAQEKPSS